RLLQQVPPGYGAVMCAVEAAVADARSNGLVEIGDKPVLDRKPGEDAEIALGDAEGHVDAPRVAPAGGDAAVAQHQPIGIAARPRRADDLAVGSFLEMAL